MTPDHAAEIALIWISRRQCEAIRLRWALVLIEAGEPAEIADAAVADLVEARRPERKAA